MQNMHIFSGVQSITRNNCARQQNRAAGDRTCPVTRCPAEAAPVSRMEVLYVIWSNVGGPSGLLYEAPQNSRSHWSIFISVRVRYWLRWASELSRFTHLYNILASSVCPGAAISTDLFKILHHLVIINILPFIIWSVLQEAVHPSKL